MNANGPAVCAVAAASRWHEFLQVYCDTGVCFSLRIYRVGKNHDTRRETPATAGEACAAGYKTNLFSQKILAAQKAIAYTDLLCVGSIVV